MKKILAAMMALTVFFSTSMSFAQTSTTNLTGVRRNVAVVMFSGLAGAVLGLSTLSFYGEPQEHIGNIWTGLAVGVAVGGAYIFSQSSRNNTAFEIQRPTNPHQVARQSYPLMQYQWDF